MEKVFYPTQWKHIASITSTESSDTHDVYLAFSLSIYLKVSLFSDATLIPKAFNLPNQIYTKMKNV